MGPHVLNQPAPELSYRARRILYSVITEYISTGEPVGSRKLSRRYGLELSPASIRNVLADLEEAGYLVQPHTSAGRVPTDRGFRLFVDALVQMREVSQEDRAAIAQRLGAVSPARDAQIREAGKLLAALSGAAAVVTPPKPEEELITQLKFIPIKARTVLAVLVSRSGSVQNRLLELERDVSPADIERVHNYLAELTNGRTLSEMRAAIAERVAGERRDYDEIRKHALLMVKATMSGAAVRNDVVIEGQGLLFNQPEFSDPEKIRAFVRTFEERENLLELLDRTLRAGGVHVHIGTEARLENVDDVSVISARFRADGGATGSVAVIGPARVDYGKLVPLVEFTARILSDNDSADDDGDDGED
jgi:heat-inducible transcriptional repressor